MKFAPGKHVQRTVAAAAAAVAVFAATGCSAVSPQATTMEYAASDGIVEDLGPLELRNILLVSPSEDEPGTLLGTVFNNSSSDVQLTIEGGSATATITIPGNGKFVFEDEDTEDGTLTGISEPPGALANLPFTVNSETKDIKIPVLDGTFERYQEFVPGGYTPAPEPSSSTSEAAEEGDH